jgi:hypothetical protein
MRDMLLLRVSKLLATYKLISRSRMMLQRQTDSNLMYLRLLHHTQEESDSLLMVVMLISLDNMLTDLHFDWGASQFVSKEVQVGVVGYAYKDIGCDSRSGDRVGCFRSQVLVIGPQLGFVIPVAVGNQIRT